MSSTAVKVEWGNETMSQVTDFPKLAKITNGNKDIAIELRTLADEIELGNHGDLCTAVLIMDSDLGVLRQPIGGPNLNKMMVAGLLTYALAGLTKNAE